MIRKITKTMKNKKGFTLVEVIVATAIVAIVSAMLLYAFVGAAGVNKRANEIKEAGRGFDNDIHMGVTDNRKPVTSISFAVTKSSTGDPLEVSTGTSGNTVEFRIPMNVYTFTGINTENRQMMVFRNPENTSTP